MAYTKEEVLLLADMADDTFRKSDPKPSFRDVILGVMSRSSVDLALTFFCSKILAYRRPSETPFLKIPLEEVPLHINDRDRGRRLLANWRLIISK